MTNEVMYEPEHPACFELRKHPAKEYKLWRRDARNTYVPRSSFCHDCTPAFKAEAEAAGLCEHPDVTFIYHEDEGLHGVRPESEMLPTRVWRAREAA